jgi:tRNA threonylcarbamoyladenosine biosynthesis protein TsaB
LNILALETSTEACSVALLTNQGVFHRYELAAQQHTELLLPMCESVLDEATIQASALDAIAVSIGPGSFTGIRIGVGTAQGIALAHALPLIGISSLQTLAQTCWRQTGADKAHCLFDARMNEVYAAEFSLNENLMQPTSAELLLTPKDISLSKGVEPAGIGWLRYELLQQAHTKLTQWPEAQDMLALAAAKFRKNELSRADNIEIQYLRNQVAHVKK